MVGKKGQVGIDALLRKEKGRLTLPDLLQEFTPGEVAGKDEKLEQLLRSLDKAAAILARANLEAHVSATAADEEYQVDLRTAESGKLRLAPAITFRCWPISLAEAHAVSGSASTPTVAEFKQVSLAALTTFFAFHIEASSAGKTANRRFVLNLPLVNAPEARKEAVLRSLIRDRESVLKLLLMLLFGDADGGVGDGNPITGILQGKSLGASATPLFESLMRALDQSPDRVEDVARLIEDIRRSPDGGSLLPEGFDKIWPAIANFGLAKLMSHTPSRPNVEAVMRGLKDFQRDTVNYVYGRLFLAEDRQRRFLIADEVGLGKTLVARGLIAKAIDRLWGKERIDVIYICSNTAIARQNINRLNVTGEKDFEIASRITLLPIRLKDLKHRKLNFISFTPGTSFDLKSSLGQADERALIYWLLKRAWNIRGKAPLNVLQGNADPKRFRSKVDRFEKDNDIDEGLSEEFEKSLKLHDEAAAREDRPTLRVRFDGLCEQFGRVRKYVPDDEADARRDFVGEVRELLATTCLTALKPDLVILDEFQRFRHLLDGTDRASGLAKDFFEHPEVRLLLLSATPYKMLTLQEDQEAGEDHYKDFARTVTFLQNNQAATDRFKLLLEDYRRELLRLGSNGTEVIQALGRQVEDTLRRVMSRIERLAVSNDRNGMLQVIPSGQLTLRSSEVGSYLRLQKIARVLQQGDLLEYWKSAPYLLNFMDGYEIKVRFDEALESGEAGPLIDALQSSSGLLLNPDEVEVYAEVDPNNARLRHLQSDTIDRGAWKLLWVPPALPYYRLGSPFDEPNLKNFTKRLVFSWWQVVPRAISSLLSYEVERRIFTGFERDPKNNVEARKRRRPLLRFSKSSGRLTGMPVLGVLYPSLFLARLIDPLRAYLDQADRSNPADLSAVMEGVMRQIEPHVAALIANAPMTGPEDESWYWAAPILLDLKDDPEGAANWLRQSDLASIWAGTEAESDADEPEGDGSATAWAEHVARARDLAENLLPFDQLGRPPADLVRIIALVAVAGPAVAALRSLSRVAGGPPKAFSRSDGTPKQRGQDCLGLRQAIQPARGDNPLARAQSRRTLLAAGPRLLREWLPSGDA